MWWEVDEAAFGSPQKKPLNPNALEFVSMSKKSSAPTAPVKKKFAEVFLDLPKGAPYSPDTAQFRTGQLLYVDMNGKSVLRPIPVKIRFCLSTNSWVLEEYRSS